MLGSNRPPAYVWGYTAMQVARRGIALMYHHEFPESFLPNRIAKAADLAMETVLIEDAVLREHRITARPAGRTTRRPHR